jgi:hypothetical protein
MSSLPNHIISGMDFKSGVVKTVNALIDYCKSHELRGDNRTIRIDQTASGTMLSALPQTSAPASSGGSGYKGPFRVVKTGENTVTVKGFDDDFTATRMNPVGTSASVGTIAGWFLYKHGYSGNYAVPIAQPTADITIYQTGLVCVSLTYNDDVSPHWYPTYGNTDHGFPLAYVIRNSTSIEKIIQLQYGNLAMGGIV